MTALQQSGQRPVKLLQETMCKVKLVVHRQ